MTVTLKTQSATLQSDVGGITIPAHDNTLYTQGFEGFWMSDVLDPDGWSGASAVLQSKSYGFDHFGPPPHSGVVGMLITNSGPVTTSRAISDLTVGYTYSLSAWVFNAGTTSKTVSVGIAGLGAGTTLTVAANSFANPVYNFTATSSGIDMEVIAAGSGAVDLVWDDLLLIEHVPEVIDPAGYPLDIVDGTITLDEGQSPYASCTLTVPNIDVAVVAAIDPRASARVTIVTAVLNIAGTTLSSRTFDLLLTDRTIDYNKAETTLILACDEAILQYFALVSATPDTSCLALQSSVRAIVDHVLGLAAGARLEENLLTNPTGRISTSGYTAVGTGTIGIDVGDDSYFQASASAASGVAGVQIQQFTVGTDILASTEYTFSASVFGSATTAGAFVSGSGVASGGAFAANAAVGVFERVSTTFTTGTSGVVAILVFNGASIVSGNTIAFADAQVERGAVASGFISDLPDADFTTLTTVENLILNPSAEVDATSWLAAGNCTISRVTSQAAVGSASIQMKLVGALAAAVVPDIAAPGNISATPGSQYTFEFNVKSAATSRTFLAALRFFNSAGTQIGSDVTGSPFASLTTGWSSRRVTATAPAGAANVWPIIEQTTAGVANEIHFLDACMLTADDGLETDGVTVYDYFDGSTTDSATYNYTWGGTPNETASTRTPVFERDPSVLTWLPGTKAWDFLSNITSAAGFRLFCDELRNWFLVDTSFSAPGVQVISEGANLYTGTDTISLSAAAVDGSPLYYQSVVIKYVWNDQNNLTQTRYDVAGSGYPCYLLEKDNTVYPGPGAAQYWLDRVMGFGRALALTAPIDYSATPSQQFIATVPFVEDQTGYVTSISWSFSSDDMSVGTRGLVDTPDTAWVEATGDWASQTATWASYTG